MSIGARPLRAVLLVLLLLGRAAHAADAGDRPRVSLRLDPCMAVDRAQVERLLVIEIGAALASEPADETSDLSARCVEGGAELRVNDPVTGKSLLRVVDLEAATVRARPRLLVLALGWPSTR